MKNFKYITKLAGILCLIAFICSLLLVLCNNLTKDKIATLQVQTEQTARTAVLKDASSFDKLSFDDNTIISEVLEGKDKNGKTIGYCFKAKPSGFGGKISMIIGIDTELNVTGIKITDMSETPGLGAKADDNWLKQFIGKTDNIEVVKTGNASGNQINAISGATITSKAVTSGVNAAIDATKTILEKEGK